MEQSMLKRLEASEIRFAEVDKELMDENIMKDMKRFRDLSKERAVLEPVVEGYRKYLRIVSDIKDAELMINDSDPEIVELGHSEHKRLIEEEAKLCEELKIALLPKDPNDDKNIIVEIRGAAGNQTDAGPCICHDLRGTVLVHQYFHTDVRTVYPVCAFPHILIVYAPFESEGIYQDQERIGQS